MILYKNETRLRAHRHNGGGRFFSYGIMGWNSRCTKRVVDAREFGTKSHEKALLLGLDILRNYRTKGAENGSGIKYFGKLIKDNETVLKRRDKVVL